MILKYKYQLQPKLLVNVIGISIIAFIEIITLENIKRKLIYEILEAISASVLMCRDVFQLVSLSNTTLQVIYSFGYTLYLYMIDIIYITITLKGPNFVGKSYE